MNRRAFRGRVRVSSGESPEFRRPGGAVAIVAHSENAKKISTPARLLSLLFLFFVCASSSSSAAPSTPSGVSPRRSVTTPGGLSLCALSSHLPPNANPLFIRTPQLTGVVITAAVCYSLTEEKSERKKDLRWPIPSRRPLSVPLFRVTPPDASTGPCESAAGGPREKQ